MIRKGYLIFILFSLLSCSENDDQNNASNTTLSIRVTVGAITTNSATIQWTVEGNLSPVTFEIILNGQEIIDGFDGYEYTFENLEDDTEFSGKVFVKQQSGIQSFDDYSFTTQLNTVFNGDVVISTQEQIDEFYYTSISGNLILCGSEIENLLELSTLESVENLKICNTSLTNLEGLNNLQQLTSTDKKVILEGNPFLENLSALSNVSSQTKWLEVKNNDVLVDLEGLGLSQNSNRLLLENLPVTNLDPFVNGKNIGRVWLLNLPNLNSALGLLNVITINWLRLENLPSLTTLEGFNNLVSLNTVLDLENLVIENFQGFNSLVSMKDFYIDDMNSLQSLSGFDNLETIDGDFTIANCPILQDFGSMPNLTNITDTFHLLNLPLLTSIEGMSNVQNINGSILEFFNLNSLESISALSNVDFSGKTIRFTNLNSLTSLTGLNGTTSPNSIWLENLNNLTTLEGLNNLTSVTSWFSLKNLNSLQSLNGLENLVEVSTYYYDEFNISRFYLENLPSLTNFEALTNLSFIGGFTIRNCPSLANLDGFDNVSETYPFGASCIISNNSSLTDFCGLTLFANSNDVNVIGFGISNNAYNPTWTQVQSETECSQ